MAHTAYIATLPESQRLALTELHAEIVAIAPHLEERLSRGVPFFYHKGKRAIGFRASKQHLSFFIMEGSVLDNHREWFDGLDHGPTVIRFTPERPLAKELLKRLIQARLAEIDRKRL